MIHFKSKTLAFVLFLSFFCPFDIHDIVSSSVNNGHIKYVKKLQIKDKRSSVKSNDNFAKSKITIDDPEIIIEYQQTVELNKVFLCCQFNPSNFIPPILKYAVWSKSTYF